MTRFRVSGPLWTIETTNVLEAYRWYWVSFSSVTMTSWVSSFILQFWKLKSSVARSPSLQVGIRSRRGRDTNITHTFFLLGNLRLISANILHEFSCVIPLKFFSLELVVKIAVLWVSLRYSDEISVFVLVNCFGQN